MPRPLNLPFDPITRAADLWRRRWGEDEVSAADAMVAVTSVMRAQQILAAELDALLRPHDLTFARYEALVLLTFSQDGRLPLSKMGARLMVHPTSVTNTVDRLESAGLVVREPNPNDRRGRFAAITERGREVVERATADLTGARFGLNGLSADDLDSVFRVLRRLRLDAGDFAEPDE